MGADWPRERRFPILVKWLDCRERLSLQVHPPKSVAAELGGEPKTENWYIAERKAGSGLLVGLRRGVTREAFERGIREENLESLIHRVEVEPGDSLLVESGRIHAIDGGNLILEIQQNSDTTYRVYDWGRKGLDGRPRALHIEESMQSIRFDDVEPDVLRTAGESAILASCDAFRIRKWEVAEGGGPIEAGSAEEPQLLHVVSGGIRFPDTADGAVVLKKGDNVLLPRGSRVRGALTEPTVYLLTDRFAGTD